MKTYHKIFSIKVPGIVENLDQELQFKPQYVEMAKNTIRGVLDKHFGKIKAKKNKKKACSPCPAQSVVS